MTRPQLPASLPRALLALALLAPALLVLAGCGRKAAPSPPGPSDQVIYPRAYPAY